MAKALLERIPPEKRWALTAKILTGLSTLRDLKTVVPLLGKGEGIISPVLGVEKWYEIDKKAFAEGARQFYPWVKETFNIPVDDAIGAAKLVWVAGRLAFGDELTTEIVEATPERIVTRYTKCPWWNRWEEHELDHNVVSCYTPHETWVKVGLKAINPKLTYKLTKAIGWGDPYCEEVVEFKEE